MLSLFIQIAVAYQSMEPEWHGEYDRYQNMHSSLQDAEYKQQGLRMFHCFRSDIHKFTRY